MTPQLAPIHAYVSQYDAIIKTMKSYLDGVREGKSGLMRPVFHPAALLWVLSWRCHEWPDPTAF